MIDTNQFLLGLCNELISRCERLQLMAFSKHDALTVFAEETSERLKQLEYKSQSLRDGDLVSQPGFVRQGYEEYQDLSRELALIEQFSIPVLHRYDADDYRTSQLVKNIAREVNFPSNLIPIGTTASNQYYWAKPELKIVAMPIGDNNGILGWPDLIHEMAHILLNAWSDFLVDFEPVVKSYFKHKRQNIADIGGGNAQDRDWLFKANLKWRHVTDSTWQVEMAANLIATFLVGPSFGWQHLRLYINHSNSPFSPSPGEPLTDHPSYQAQLDGILEMLSLLKLSKEGKKIEEQWSSILQIYDHQRPQGYELYYPSELIHGIAKTVYFSCRRYGLVPFSDKSHKPAINLITTAWEQFLSAPSNYPKWEKDSLEKFFSV